MMMTLNCDAYSLWRTVDLPRDTGVAGHVNVFTGFEQDASSLQGGRVQTPPGAVGRKGLKIIMIAKISSFKKRILPFPHR